MANSGLAFHCHHDILIEFCFDYAERVAYIKDYKPAGEQELRLRLFKLIPEDRIPAGYSGRYQALTKAREEVFKLTREGDWEAYNTAREAYSKAWEACNKAHGQEIEALHAELCPNCPWDGTTIFPRKEG